MDRPKITDDMTSAERSGTGVCPVPHGWDDLDIIRDRDLPGSPSWITDLQVVEVAAALGGLAALVNSLAARLL